MTHEESALPEFNRHASDRPIMIIGAGEIVWNRLVPALLLSGYKPDRIVIRTTGLAEDFAAAPGIFGIECSIDSADAIIEAIDAWRGNVVIATPPCAREKYLRRCSKTRLRFVVEKPLFAPQWLSSSSDATLGKIMSNGFALSYYTLEKALPLTAIIGFHPEHLRLVHISGATVEELREGMARTGALVDCSIRIMEGAERSATGNGRRDWMEQPTQGGLLFDFFSHTAAILHMLIGGLAALEIKSVTLGRSEEAGQGSQPTSFDVSAHHGSARIRLAAAKYVRDEAVDRSMVALFENGRIECSFDERSCMIDMPGVRARVALRRELGENYGALIALSRRFLEHGWMGEARYDDFAGQVAALRWLRRLDMDTPIKLYRGIPPRPSIDW